MTLDEIQSPFKKVVVKKLSYSELKIHAIISESNRS
jgi:hypothetical protein